MSTTSNGRKTNGRFAKGHAGGPGRPRRPVEQEYLATLNAAVTIDAWAKIVERAVADAVEGDAKAREWLAKYLVGEERTSLVQLAADERAGLTADEVIDAAAVRQQLLKMTFNGDGFRRALLTSMVRTAPDAASGDIVIDEGDDL